MELFNLQGILATGSVQSVYQPVISVSRGRTVFEEALGRGLSPQGTLISPLPMIEAARSQGLLHELDRQFVSAGLRGWASRSGNVALSLNLDASCIGPHSVPYLLDLIQLYQVSPKQIIIEICENRTPSPAILTEFVKACRKHGFLIAIDDLGKEHSNLDRILALAPDLIKLDRELIMGVHLDPKKQSLVKSMARFGQECGACVIAEGVEQWEEGIDLFQGYYFIEPRRVPPRDSHWFPKAEVVRRAFRVHRANQLRRSHEIQEHLNLLCERACVSLLKKTLPELDAALARYVQHIPQLECLFVLDSWGEQISHTHVSPRMHLAKSLLYRPGEKGEDHSLKDYFAHLPRHGSYLSQPYISQATGRPCRTFSRWFFDQKQAGHVLCLDLPDV